MNWIDVCLNHPGDQKIAESRALLNILAEKDGLDPAYQQAIITHLRHDTQIESIYREIAQYAQSENQEDHI